MTRDKQETVVDASTRLALGEDVTFQSLGAGQQTAVLSLRTGYLYTCNETTAAMLSAIDGRRSLDEIVELLMKKFDVPREKLTGDLSAMAGKLVAEKLLTVVE